MEAPVSFVLFTNVNVLRMKPSPGIAVSWQEKQASFFLNISRPCRMDLNFGLMQKVAEGPKTSRKYHLQC